MSVRHDLNGNHPLKRYYLPANEAEKDRLNVQYHLITRIFGNRRVFAPLQLQDGDTVLDAATGTGIWTMDTASISPAKVTFVGVDVSQRLFPITSPTNVSFMTSSVLSLPESWSSRFQLVNQRMLLAAFNRKEWSQNLAELYRVLMPGGWVQLVEMRTAYEGSTGPAMDATTNWSTAVRSRQGTFAACADYLAEMVAEAGFIDIGEEKSGPYHGKPGGEDGAILADVRLWTLRGFKTTALRDGGVAGIISEKAVDEMLDSLQAEWASTDVKVPRTFVMVTAKKPLGSSNT